MRRMLAALLILSAGFSAAFASAQDAIVFDEPNRELDQLVQACLNADGVNMLEGTDVLCYNAAIFPEEFLQLNDMPPASRIIITSPGGNVATARVMSGILDKRGEPAVIAGPCMSACAMVLLSGLDDVYIHHTAHIAVHGITMIPFGRWWGWLKDDAEPSAMNIFLAQSGYDLKFSLHASGTSQMREHLAGQHVDVGFIQEVSDRMEADARAFTSCRVDVKDYWGILDANYLRKYLGDRITGMEAFVQDWDDPQNQAYRFWGKEIAYQTYIMKDPFKKAGCSYADITE